MSHTFVVQNTEISDWAKKKIEQMGDWMKSEEYLHRKVRNEIRGESVLYTPVDTIGGSSPLFNACGLAFNMHYPLIIRPDDVWLTCLTGLVNHIDADPEEARQHFVKHEGKTQLSIKTGPDQYETGVRMIGDLLQDHIGKKYDLIVNNFSTTTPTDELSSKIALMGAMKHYFGYKMMLCCGLNQVTIEGTPEDWENIENRAYALSEMGLQWWTDHLIPVIQQFRNACNGQPDVDFWNRMYLEKGYGSGGQSDVTGWVNVFNPYVAGVSNLERNPYIDWENASGDGTDADNFPSGLVSVPVVVNDHGIEYDFEFYGGLVGVKMDPKTYAVQAASGYTFNCIGLREE